MERPLVVGVGFLEAGFVEEGTAWGALGVLAVGASRVRMVAEGGSLYELCELHLLCFLQQSCLRWIQIHLGLVNLWLSP